MTKTFTCRELGGVCDEKFSGNSLMEIVQKGMQHMQSDEIHMKKIGDLSNSTSETKEQWFERMQKEFDARMNDIPLFVDNGANAVRQDLPFVERDAITAVLYDPKANKYLGLKWKKVDWDTLITGGIEVGQTAEEAARMEIAQETGYKNIRLVSELPRYDSKFFHHPKGVNRYAHFRCFFFELVNDEREIVSSDELEKHTCIWLSREEMEQFRLPEGHRFIFNQVIGR
ncbi:MAG: NUDIX hydrolase [Patescibacteria group bacterium]